MYNDQLVYKVVIWVGFFISLWTEKVALIVEYSKFFCALWRFLNALYLLLMSSLDISYCHIWYVVFDFAQLSWYVLIYGLLYRVVEHYPLCIGWFVLSFLFDLLFLFYVIYSIMHTNYWSTSDKISLWTPCQKI